MYHSLISNIEGKMIKEIENLEVWEDIAAKRREEVSRIVVELSIVRDSYIAKLKKYNLTVEHHPPVIPIDEIRRLVHNNFRSF